MKKIVCILLTSLLLIGTALAADPVDLSTYTDAELDALRIQVAEEILARRMAGAPDDAAADFHYVSNGAEVRINAWIGEGTQVYIPDEINGVPVTQIYDNAFNDNKTIETVRFPSELVSIGDKAFLGTFGLSEPLVLPKKLQAIGQSAFAVTFAKGVVLQSDCALDLEAFSNAMKLEFLYIREGCAVTMDRYAFKNTPMTVAVIPASVTVISPFAFSGCSNLTVYCPAGSYAEKYCLENFIVCNTANYEAMVAYYEALYPAG